MSTPTTPLPTSVHAFVAAVRAELDDLSAEEVNELTGGLEADLADSLAESESNSPAEHYGDPAAYARELRAAAGLPPRRAGRRRLVGGDYPNAARLWFAELRHTVETNPYWPQVREFLIVLRPAWWVLRAWILVQALMLTVWGPPGSLVVGGFLGFLLLVAAVVLSVQIGRRSDAFEGRSKMAMLAVNVIAVLALVPVVGQSQPSTVYQNYGYSDPTPGTSLDGQAVTNIFPYDDQGRPLTGVQLFNQAGHPLEVGENNRSVVDDNGNQVDLVPGSAEGTPQRWNVYPMRERPYVETTDSEGNSTETPGVAQDANLPFGSVPPLLAAPEATPGVTPTPSETVTPGPSETPTEAPTPTPTSTSKK